MDTTIKHMLTKIHNADEDTINFLTEWNNDLPYIKANTSGSTGIPKEIHLLKKDMITSAKATCDFFNITNKSLLVLPLSPNYIAGKMMIIRALVSEAELWIEKPSNYPLKTDYGQIDLLPIVPSQADWLINECKYTQNIKNLLIGGGFLSKKREVELNALKINTFVSYGMTETCSHIALRKISDEFYHTLPSINISTDSRNCLVIDAPHFSFKSITTNDIVEIVDNKRFKWIGRYDNVINTGGIKVFPEQIEQKLAKIIDLPFYIIGENDNKWGECVTLYIEATYIDSEFILQEASKILDKHHTPKKIKCIPKFERTESGKIKRKLY